MAKQDREIRLMVHPELRLILDATPTGDLVFVLNQYGRPFTQKGFGVAFRDWCDQAGLPQCTAHGLRKLSCVRMLYAGATLSEVAKCSGHRNESQLNVYIEKVDQRRLADAGMTKLIENKSSNRTRKIV
jgi:integrase